MASKPVQAAPKVFPKTVWIDCELSADHKKHLKSLQVSSESIVQGMDTLICDGYKLSIVFEEKNDCVGVYLTAPRDPAVEFTLCLSARGPSVEKALMVLHYKHFELLQSDWSGKMKAGSYIDPWG